MMMPTDSMFLFAESREHPMHVGGLSLYEPPEGAGPEFVRDFFDALVGLNMAPLTLAGVRGFLETVPPPFNIVISNVPGPAEQMYYGGARLDGSYPMSNIPDGQALNITLVNNAGNLDFGLVGCRRSVPHLQRLLAHLEESLKDLERAVGV